MSRDKIENLLDRYLRKETSVEENQVIERWLADNGNAEPEWQRLDRLDKDQWLSNVFSDIKNTINTDKPKTVVVKSRRYIGYKVASVAAALVVSFCIFLSWPVLENILLSADLTTISVPDHQKKQIILPDGSKVWLNGGSQLKYPEPFNGQSRTVYLSGEAYFDIQHDETKPFLIHTGKVLTRVLGTAFNIKEDQHTHTLEVTVTRGKVSVSDDGKLLGVLTPNQQLKVNLLDGSPTETTVDIKPVIAWQQTDMLFDDITFEEAASQLEQRFGVKIAFENDELKNCRFSGIALKGDQLEKVLKVICAFNNATWQMNPDGTILIDGQGCEK